MVSNDVADGAQEPKVVAATAETGTGVEKPAEITDPTGVDTAAARLQAGNVLKDEKKEKPLTEIDAVFAVGTDIVTKVFSSIAEKAGCKSAVGFENEESFKNALGEIPHGAVVVIGMTMKRISGAEVAQDAFKKRPDLKIIITSGWGEPNDEVKELMEQGLVKGFLPQPASSAQLLEALQKVA